jgi:hypothetical protein
LWCLYDFVQGPSLFESLQQLPEANPYSVQVVPPLQSRAAVQYSSAPRWSAGWSAGWSGVQSSWWSAEEEGEEEREETDYEREH